MGGVRDWIAFPDDVYGDEFRIPKRASKFLFLG